MGMTISNKGEPFVLLLGDIIVFIATLWLTLLIRYSEAPSSWLFQIHIAPFSIIFLFWILIFFIAGLYEKHTRLLKSRLPALLFKVQIINSIIAVLFFYLIPYFGINPKTNLFICLILSFVMILIWRLFGTSLLGFRYREKAVLIGSGEEMRELYEEINGNSKYSIYFVSSFDTKDIDHASSVEKIAKAISDNGVSSIVVDLSSEKTDRVVSRLYDLVISGVRLIDIHNVYEDTFDRIPVSLLSHNWFLKNISGTAHIGYDFLKRFMDIIIGVALGVVSLVLYPFVILAIKLEDGGGIFSFQSRVGMNNKIIKIIKFRTMTVANDNAEWGSVENKVTRVGSFLRKSRIDELPQLWNVLKGDISLIGPRPEFERPVKEYSEKIPYYNTRHLIKPGLSGWAQIYHERHPHHGVDIEETKNKLSYDLYYIKNRSFMLDLEIALKTVRTLLSRSGA